MSMIVWNMCLFFLCYLESRMCYQFLFLTVIKRDGLRRIDECLIQGNIILTATLATINRRLFFFSQSLFIMIFSLVLLCVWWVYRKKRRFSVLIVSIYFSLVALLDYVFAFCCVEFMGEDFSAIIFWNSKSWWMIGIFAVSRCIVFVILSGLRRTSNFNVEEMTLELGAVAAVLLVILRYYQVSLADMVVGESTWKGISMAISLLVGILIITIGTLLIIKNKLIQRENEYLMMRDETMVQSYRKIAEEIEQNRILMHDMKHELLLLNEYVKKEDFDSIKRYVEDRVASSVVKKTNVWTQERIWDSIISQKKEEAERKGITVYIDSGLVSEFPFNEREGCSIFGNLLDNAIEACEKVVNDKREIHINIHRHHNLTFLEISNTTEEKLNYKNGVLVTTKKSRAHHGYGLKSVQRIVEKYDGIMEYQKRGNIFSIRLSFFEIEKQEGE